PLDDEDRARRRGIVIGPQGVDGMSKLSGWVTPQWRATVEAICAELGAPGMCDPAQKNTCTDGTLSAEQIDGDKRSVEQRTHDALLAAGAHRLGLREPRQTQRPTGDHRHHHHPARPHRCRRGGHHRRGHRAPHE
ncbi:DUF222 domain-containing protein, partial [Mycolicibacterium insubricum]|nr:DUF222 domain-containing protein [Mycolicibacterium insubricum]